MNIVVLFGSSSDHGVYSPLVEGLHKQGHQVAFEVLSAHRDPLALNQFLDGPKGQSAHAFVAGAGLAAHLPGVVASRTKAPVFGVPVESMLGGLDALLSIMQMPAGVPVLTCAPGRANDVVAFLEQIQTSSAAQALACMDADGRLPVNVCVNEHLMNYEYLLQELQRAYQFADSQQIRLQVTQKKDPLGLNIVLVQTEEEVRSVNEAEGICLHVPLFDQHNKHAPERALELLKLVKRGGLWVGVNNIRNAIASYRKCVDRFNQKGESYAHA